jgi:NADH dehydrogenase FAD-containing subunit
MSLLKKKVVVVGCGGAGSNIAAKLAKTKKYEVTVITPFDYMEISLGMTMVIATGPEEHKKFLHPLLREEGADYVNDIVTGITNDSVTLASGQTLPFDACVIGVGQRIVLA